PGLGDGLLTGIHPGADRRGARDPDRDREDQDARRHEEAAQGADGHLMDHEDMEALLAGYALRSLSSEDEAVADRLLAEHVPGCFSCREALEAFQVVASELAVEPAPMDPPETLLPRLRNDLRPGGRRRRVPVLAVAASVAGLIALSGLAVTPGGRLRDARQQTILPST